MRIGILGDAIVDVDIHAQPRDNYEGASQCFTAAKRNVYPGGAANVAWLLVDMGVDVTLFAAVGRGHWADELWASAFSAGTLMPFQVTTNVCQRTYVNGGLKHRVDIDASGKEGQWIERYPYGQCLRGIPGDSAEMFDSFVFADYAKGIFGENSGCEEVVRRIIASGLPTVVDPHEFGRSGLWAGATVATPNIREHEALGFLGTQWTTVTRGNIGVGLYEGDEAREFYRVPEGQSPANPQVVGAGDAFTAMMAKALAEGVGIPEATEKAMLFATRYVSRERGAPIPSA